ncbi:MAG: cysteine hydrolase [Gemmatimonadales bacterium]|jgi:nicotinamidase-related amidase
MSTRLPQLNLPVEKIDPRKTALLIIDMQRYFVHPEYPFGQFISGMTPERSQYYYGRVGDMVIPNTQRLLEQFRSRGAYVVYTEFGSAWEDGRDMAGWARRHNDMAREQLGSPIYPPFADDSCRVDDSLAPRSDEMIVQKTTSGPLNSTRLDDTLRVIGVSTVIVTGVVTDVCVAQTTREFGDRNFDAIVVSDACATFDDQTQDATMATIANTFGFVASTNEILQML